MKSLIQWKWLTRGAYREQGVKDEKLARKRTKSDKAQRQADELEGKLERRPAQVPRKKVTREDLSQATAQIVPEGIGNH